MLKLLIIFTLILFPFGELLRFEMGNNIVVKPLDVVVGLAAAVFLFQKKYPISNIQYQISKPILFFAGVGLFSLLINLTWLKGEDFWASSLYLIRWGAYAMLLPIVMSFDEKFKKKLAIFLFIDGVLFVLAGFVQYFFFNNLKPFFYLGWDEHMHRMFSTFLDPNFAGAFFVLFFLFTASRLSFDKFRIARRRNLFFSSVLLLTLIAVFLTFSRGALLSLLAGSGTFLILIKQKKLIFVLLAAVFLFVLVASPKFYDENMNLLRTASSQARLANYDTAFQLIKDRPLLGVGFNSYRYAKESYGYQAGTFAPSHADAGVDNSFLFVLATTGIIGLIAYCSLLSVILRRAYYMYKKQANIMAVVVISSIAALFVNALFINSLFFPPLMLWMWMLVGILGARESR